MSDAMSEGERPDEASSLHLENEDHGMQSHSSALHLHCYLVKAYMLMTSVHELCPAAAR